MDKTINITVKDKIATAPKDAEYVCGNSDYVINFSFDSEWGEFETKTARFKVKGKPPIDQIFSGNVCPIPQISDTYSFEVGVYAGDLHTTTPAYVPARKSILCGGGTPADPPDDVYNQIMKRLNEIGTTDPEAIAAAVAEYIAANPITETDPTVPDWAKAKKKPTYTAEEVGAIAETELQTAINTALAQAKASGEFDGADGQPGADGSPGKDGADGKDGVSVTHSWNGTVLSVTSASGTSSADLKGDKGDKGETGEPGTPGAAGADGYTPVKGTDYFTEADKEEIATATAEKVSVPETLPNPNALTFTGAVEASYDGSSPVTVEIPSGGGGDAGQWEYIGEFTETDQPTFESGKYRFFFAKAFFTSDTSSGATYRYLCIDGFNYMRWHFGGVITQSINVFIAHGMCSLHYGGAATNYLESTNRGNAVLHLSGSSTTSKGTAFWASTDTTNYPISTFGIKLWGAK